jgi:hypothetical protein
MNAYFISYSLSCYYSLISYITKMSSTEPGHTNDEHTTMDGNPDRRFKEVRPLPPPFLRPFLPRPSSESTVTDKQNGGGQHGNQGGRETGFEEIGDGSSSLVTEGTGEDTGTYKYVFCFFFSLPFHSLSY